MRLVNTFAIWYLAITTVVLLAGGVLVFYAVQHENDEEEIRRLRGLITDAQKRIESGDTTLSPGSNVGIAEISPKIHEISLRIIDTVGFHSEFQGNERQHRATKSFKIRGRHFLITATAFAPEPEETLAGVVESLSWIFVILILIVGITTFFVSKRILAPFNKTLSVMEGFHLQQKENVLLPTSKTKEFQTLNLLLQRMTEKALKDYRSLKEFSENASHELQTPLAIIRGKLELLLASPLSDDQASLIIAANEAVEKLSKTNQALTLLTKLENQEYTSLETIDFSVRVEKTIESVAELIEMKSIRLLKEIQPNVFLNINPALADILLINLLSNAIRHNNTNGMIKAILNHKTFTIQNSGMPLDIPADQLFLRFKKSNQSSDSIGLGLSIVKQICEVSGFKIDYSYSDNLHTLQIHLQA